MPLTWVEVTFLGPRLAILVTRGRPSPAHGTAPHLCTWRRLRKKGSDGRGLGGIPASSGESLGGAEDRGTGGPGPSELQAGQRRGGLVWLAGGWRHRPDSWGREAQGAGCKEGGGWASHSGLGVRGTLGPAAWVEVWGGKKGRPEIPRAGRAVGAMPGRPRVQPEGSWPGTAGIPGLERLVRGVEGGTGVCVGGYPREAPCVPSFWSSELLGPGRP